MFINFTSLLHYPDRLIFTAPNVCTDARDPNPSHTPQGDTNTQRGAPHPLIGTPMVG
jgi:hypothetical protein